MHQCASYMPTTRSASINKWFQVCQWNYAHVTQDYLHISRTFKEREPQMNVPQAWVRPINVLFRKTRLVLASQQLLAPQTTPLRYVEMDEPKLGLELVSSHLHYTKAEYPFIKPQ